MGEKSSTAVYDKLDDDLPFVALNTSMNLRRSIIRVSASVSEG